MTRRRIRRLAAAAVLLTAVLLATAGGWRAARPHDNVTLRARAVAIEQQLRCPTCQGLSVADSPSPIAAGMRREVQTQLAAGADAAQIRASFIARYGDWILLAPPRRGIGLLVWTAPAVAVFAGLLLVTRTLRRRRDATPAVTAAETADAARWLSGPVADGAHLPEPLAAAVADVRAAQRDAEFDPAGAGGADAAIARLATALRDHPTATSASGQPVPIEATPTPTPASAPPIARPRQRRYAIPVAAVTFAALLGATLAHAVGNRPAGAVPTGTFATDGAATASSQTVELRRLRAVTRTRQRDPGAWLAYATALDQAGQLAAAEPAYRHALALDPTSVTVRERLAWLLTRGGSPDEALTLLRPLNRVRQDDPQVVLLVGLAQRGAGVAAWTPTLRHYLRLQPDGAQAELVRQLVSSNR